MNFDGFRGLTTQYFDRSYVHFGKEHYLRNLVVHGEEFELIVSAPGCATREGSSSSLSCPLSRARLTKARLAGAMLEHEPGVTHPQPRDKQLVRLPGN